MDHRRQVLVVARNPKVAERLISWLAARDREATLTTTFANAKTHLDLKPDLVVAEVKLGEYNGLHLALKADAVGIPTVIIGPPDPVLQKDADSIHAVYLPHLTRASLLEAVDKLLATPASSSADAGLPFRARVTTIAAEAEVMWRAFTESPSSELSAFGRPLLPN